MPNLTVSIPHSLPRAEVKKRIQDQIGNLRQKHGQFLGSVVQETWTGDRLDFSASAMGQSIGGHLAVDDKAVHVEIVLPALLGLLAGQVKQTIEQQGRILLGGPITS